jgi:transcriptional regulator with XRE-family HTH domain
MSAVEPDGELPGGLLRPLRADATVLRMLLGSQLRRLREAVGITPEQAGYEIRASRSKISRMENGRVSFKVRDIVDLLTLYGVTSEAVRSATLELAKRANTPGWWAQYGDIMPDWLEMYLGLEASASIVRSFELQFVHGLFQTEDYARAVTKLGFQAAQPSEIERRVALRMKRQGILAEAQPPRIWTILDEAVLRRPVGGRQVMRAQLRHLAEAADLPHVTLQVLPFGLGGHAGAGGSFTILRFDEPDLPDVVYIEHLTSALYLDARSDVDHYQEVMNRLSTDALTPETTASVIDGIISDI